MIWWPETISYGDVLRVRLGSIWHYGICVGEDRVIQFGKPPRRDPPLTAEELRVQITDLETFASGSIVETGRPESGEKCFSKEETARRAMARLGEEGYHILRNNCEHFVMECLTGLHLCAQTRTRYSRVYIAPIPEEVPEQHALPKTWTDGVIRKFDPERRRTRAALGRLLEEALADALGSRPEYAGLTSDIAGVWHSAIASVSMAASKHYCAVGLASEAIGIGMAEGSADPGKLCLEALKRRETEAKAHPVKAAGEAEIFRSELMPCVTFARAGSGLVTGWYRRDETGFRFLGEKMKREEKP